MGRKYQIDRLKELHHVTSYKLISLVFINAMESPTQAQHRIDRRKTCAAETHVYVPDIQGLRHEKGAPILISIGTNVLWVSEKTSSQ